MKKLFSFSYIKSLLQPESKDSIKSFSMFLSTILGFILGIMLGISIMIDAWDGSIDTDMYGCAAYVVAIGALVTLSSIPKMAVDRKKLECSEQSNDDSEISEEIAESEEEKPKRKSRKRLDD